MICVVPRYVVAILSAPQPSSRSSRSGEYQVFIYICIYIFDSDRLYDLSKMRLLLSLWGILLVLIVPPSLALQTPQPRSYDTHTYYALELDPSTSPAVALQVSKSLGVELVERIGELDGHWLVRTEGRTPEHASITRRSASHDPVLKRWEVLSSSLGKKSLTPLSLKQRVKRHKSHFPRSLYSRDDRTELLYAQNELHLADPMLDQQWHLINTQMKDIELNVTGLWGRGVTGEGVHVVIIDDGLDVESKDLKDNFVRCRS